jgi:hypothetical protein
MLFACSGQSKNVYNWHPHETNNNSKVKKKTFQKVTFGRIMPLYFLIIALGEEKKMGGV